jgi:hypothetical protein
MKPTYLVIIFCNYIWYYIWNTNSFLHTKMSELFTRITFSATTDRRTIPDGFVLTQGEVELLCESLAKNLPPIDKLF